MYQNCYIGFLLNLKAMTAKINNDFPLRFLCQIYLQRAQNLLKLKDFLPSAEQFALKL
jgi:hypothetical protein